MSQDPELVYNQLNHILANTTSVTSDQIVHLNAGIQGLFLQLINEITPEQKRLFEDNIKRSHFLMSEITGYWEIYDLLIRLLHKPKDVIWTEVEVYEVVSHAIEDAKKFARNSSDFITLKKNNQEIFIYGPYPLLQRALSSLVIWLHLIAPSNHLTISVVEHDIEIELKFSGYVPASKEIDFIDELVCGLSRDIADRILLVLNGSSQWESDQIIPRKRELLVKFPKKPNA